MMSFVGDSLQPEGRIIDGQNDGRKEEDAETEEYAENVEFQKPA